MKIKYNFISTERKRENFNSTMALINLVLFGFLTLSKLIGIVAASQSPQDDNRVQSPARLELVQVLFRNGERLPYSDEGYPNDPHNGLYQLDRSWGQLTSVGRRRARRLGQFLRRRYADELLERYPRPEDVYVYSLDRDCCKASLQLVLESLYGSEMTKEMEEEDRRPLIPIRSLPEELDVLMNLRKCSLYRKEMDKVRKLPEIEKKLAKYEGLYRYDEFHGVIAFRNL